MFLKPGQVRPVCVQVMKISSQIDIIILTWDEIHEPVLDLPVGIIAHGCGGSISWEQGGEETIE